MSFRWRTILSRFPAHMEATRPDKQLRVVTEALAQDLDVLSAALARVRRAHRLADADETGDLLLLGGLHGVTRGELALAFTRFDLARKLPAGTPAEAASVAALWGIGAPGFDLNRYATDPQPQQAATLARFGRYLKKSLSAKARNDAVRRRIAAIAAIHVEGNGTVRALAAGAANALDCDVLSLVHSEDRYYHLATIRDRVPLLHPVMVQGKEEERVFAPAEEELLIEENPLERETTTEDPRKHSELIPVTRRGFESTRLQVRITGIQNRTAGPMFVNRDQGCGVGFADTVPNGSTLVFTEEGRALLDDQDVTARCFSWKGAVFGEGGPGVQPNKMDFVFAGPGVSGSRAARFVEENPAGSLEAQFNFPHAGANLDSLEIAVGVNRFAFFAQEGCFHGTAADGAILWTQPRTASAYFDGSVFAPGAGEQREAAARVALSWMERCAFRARIWIPRRFLALTPGDLEGLETRRQVLAAVERFRPAGVRLDVEFSDSRWVLGRGVVFGEASDTPAISPGIGMELWTAPAEPPVE